MRIQFQRTGGFAGIKLTGQIDENNLNEDERAELRNLLNNAGLPQSGEPMLVSARKPQPDRFNYRLVIMDDDGQERTLSLDEAALTPSLEPLIDFLSDQAKKNRTTQ